MTALELLTAEKQAAGIAEYVPSTFSENLSAAFGQQMFSSDINIAPFAMSNTLYRERDDLIKQRLGVEDPFSVIDTSELDKKYSNPTQEGKLSLLREKQSLLDSHITSQRSVDPEAWKDIKTSTEIEDYIKTVAKSAYIEAGEVQQATGTIGGVAGGLVGGAAGSFTDPINLATLPFGAASSARILSAMGTEALINMGVEAVEIPMRKKWQEELGFKYGVGEATQDILFAGLGGAGFTGIIRGAAHGFKAIGSRSSRILDKAADETLVNSFQREALKYSARVAHIDETIPINGRSISSDDLSIHRSALSETQDAFNNYRNPDLSIAYQRFDLSDVSHTSTGKLSEDNLARLGKHSTEPVVVSEDARFESRSAADNYIRKKAEEDGLARTDFLVETDDAGKKVVLRVNKGVQIHTDAEGNPKEFSSREKAKEEAVAVSKNGEPAHVLSLNPKAGKAEQRHFVLKGRDLTAKDVANLRKKPEFLNITRPERIEEEYAPDLRNAKLVNDAYFTIRDAIGDIEQSVEIASDPKNIDAFNADFDRLVNDSPDTVVNIDGRNVSMAELKEVMDDNNNILQAVKVCAIG